MASRTARRRSPYAEWGANELGVVALRVCGIYFKLGNNQITDFVNGWKWSELRPRFDSASFGVCFYGVSIVGV